MDKLVAVVSCLERRRRMANPHDVWYRDDYNYDDIIQTMYYDKEQNVFMDADGFVIFNLFTYITPNDLMLFKRNKEDMEVLSVSGEYFIELVYPEHEEEDIRRAIRRMNNDRDYDSNLCSERINYI